MKTLIAVICLMFAFTAAASARTKETQAQKEIIHRFWQYVEQQGWRVSAMSVKGKDGDILGINLPGADAEATVRFKAFIDESEAKPQIKAAGFRFIQISTGFRSISFPKGELLISLDE
jgi:hypothetical protein